MIKGIAKKASICTLALLSSLYIGMSLNSVSVAAEEIATDNPVAGMTRILEEYYESVVGDKGEAEKYLDIFISQSATPTIAAMTEIISPYANLGVSIADNYVNIRTEPNTESEIVGKLYRGCATDILDVDGEWVKIKSGKVEGYIKTEYLAIGADAEALVEEYAVKYAKINTETLFVRKEPSTKAKIVTMVPGGEVFTVLKEDESWVEIIFDGDVQDADYESGFVSKDYVEIEVKFQYAISIEEELAILAAEEAARQAEAERLAQLARDKAAKAAADKAAAEKAAKAAAQKSNSGSSSQSSSKGSSSNSSSSSSSSKGSGTGSQIANYAVKFVGNPYRWGGTSLTNGADCSGFVSAIYSQFGYSVPRTSSSQASSAGRSVDMGSLQPGDLIFYRNSSGVVNHVAIFIGNGKVVHASNQRDGIKISNYNYRTPYKARRIVN